jgi:hypothetical protein
MTAPPVPDDPSGEFGAFTPMLGVGNDRKSARLLLSDADRTREALLASRIAVEHIRVVQPSDSRVTAKYAATVIDNSRLLAGGNPRLHLSLLGSHVKWLKSLPTGFGELR